MKALLLLVLLAPLVFGEPAKAFKLGPPPSMAVQGGTFSPLVLNSSLNQHVTISIDESCANVCKYEGGVVSFVNPGRCVLIATDGEMEARELIIVRGLKKSSIIATGVNPTMDNSFGTRG